ncbi:MAG: recombinase family protein [Steroidobacteraceae bacterium]
MLRAAIYTRVSSDRDGGGRSVGEQEAACRTDCERNGWTVAEVLTDNDRSASRWSRKGRPAYDQLAELLTAGRADVLVTWEASRAQRDLTAYAALRDLCARHGVKWSYSGRLYDLTDSDDRFSTGIDALVSEREADLTRKRILRSVEARAADGRAHGQLHDGYKVEYDPRTGKPLRRVLDPERAPIIREITDRLLAGDSAYTIARDFNDRALTTSKGKPWRGQNIARRAQSPTIAGLRVHRGQVLDVEAKWPAIVTPEEHARLLVLLSDPRRKANKEGAGVKHLLTGIARCGECGAPVRMISGYRPNGTHRVRYGCSANHCVQRAAELVDLMIEKLVIGRLSQPDVLAELAEATRDTEAQEAAAEVARLKAKLAQARAMVDVDRLSLESLADLESRTLPRIFEAERRARPRHVPGAVLEVAGPDAAARWATLPMTKRRAIVKSLLDVRIHRTARGNQHSFDPSAIQVRPLI